MESFDEMPMCIYYSLWQSLKNILQFAHVKTGQTYEERIAIVKTTTHQGTCCQERRLICHILSNTLETTHLNETSITTR